MKLHAAVALVPAGCNKLREGLVLVLLPPGSHMAVKQRKSVRADVAEHVREQDRVPVALKRRGVDPAACCYVLQFVQRGAKACGRASADES